MSKMEENNQLSLARQAIHDGFLMGFLTTLAFSILYLVAWWNLQYDSVVLPLTILYIPLTIILAFIISHFLKTERGDHLAGMLAVMTFFIIIGAFLLLGMLF